MRFDANLRELIFNDEILDSFTRSVDIYITHANASGADVGYCATMRFVCLCVPCCCLLLLLCVVVLHCLRSVLLRLCAFPCHGIVSDRAA